MKDNFSQVSSDYAQFRPTYPHDVFKYFFSLAQSHERVWDCATGNGQVAIGLSPYFKQVIATDISAKQIEHAYPAENIQYSISPAEHTSFPENYFDLITVGQAIHWFDFDTFYSEARRVARHNATLAVIGYDLVRIDDATDKIILHFYEGVLKDCWDAERKYIDEKYRTIPFPFKEIQPPQFQLQLEWTLQHLLGFLSTWSGVQHYKNRNQRNPIDEVINDLMKVWNENEIKTVTFPFMLRVGIVEK